MKISRSAQLFDSSKKLLGKVVKISFFVLFAVGVLVFTIEFLVQPYTITGNPIEPFERGQLVLGERITYLFRQPELGERVVFETRSNSSYTSYIGIVTGIERRELVTQYEIQSSADKLWVVSGDKIKRRIYLPLVSRSGIVIERGGRKPDSDIGEAPRKISEIISLDKVWSKYINHELGFSIKIPKEVYDLRASCVWREGGDSYRPGGGPASLKVFEEGNQVHLVQAYYYDLTGETKEDGRASYSGCTKIENTLQALKDSDRYSWGWKLIVGDVDNENELNTFIKESAFHSGCYVGEMKPALQEGVYDVTVTGDPVEDNEYGWLSTCPVMYVYSLRYYPEGERVVFWVLG